MNFLYFLAEKYYVQGNMPAREWIFLMGNPCFQAQIDSFIDWSVLSQMINFTVSLLYNTVIKGYARGAKVVAEESSLSGTDWSFYNTCSCNAWNRLFLCSTILWSRFTLDVQSFFAEESSLLGTDWSFYSTYRCNAWKICFLCSRILWSRYMPEV